MRGQTVGLRIGGRMRILYLNYDDPEEFADGADDVDRVGDILEAFV